MQRLLSNDASDFQDQVFTFLASPLMWLEVLYVYSTHALFVLKCPSNCLAQR